MCLFKDVLNHSLNVCMSIVGTLIRRNLNNCLKNSCVLIRPMSNLRQIDLHSLVESSKGDPNILTIEATVITGFEFQAADECQIKCEPISICKAKGRIYFNIYLHEFQKVFNLKSVDNLYLVGESIKVINFEGIKENDIEIIKSLVHKVDWKDFITSWSKLVNFNGILFPEKKIESSALLETSSEKEEISDTITDKSSLKDESSDKSDTLPPDSESTMMNLMNEMGELKKACEATELNVGLALAEIQGQGDVLSAVEKLTDLMKFDETKDEPSEQTEPDSDVINENVKLAENINVGVKDSRHKVGYGKKKFGSKFTKQKKERTGPGPKPYVDDGILKYRVTCFRAGPSHSFSSMEAAAEFGGKLQDTFNWTVDLTRFDLNVVLVIEENSGYVASALTKESFHRRNITHFGRTTLRATLCYNLIYLASPSVGDIVLDPLCGGGSIPIEGSISYPKTFNVGGDIDEKAINRTIANIENLTKERGLPIDSFKWDALNIPLKDESVDIFVTDLPFGRRSGKKSDNSRLYERVLISMARVVRMGTGRASILTYDRKALTMALWKCKQWKQMRSFNINQGGLNCSVFLLLRNNDKLQEAK